MTRRTPSTTGVPKSPEARPAPASGGLIIPKAVGIGNTALQAIHKQFTTHPEVEKELVEMGVQDRPQPLVRAQELTSDNLGTDDGDRLRRLMAEQNSWLNYFSPILARTESRLLEVETQLKILESTIKKSMVEYNKTCTKDQRITDKEMELELNCNEMYREVLVECVRLKQYKIGMEAEMSIINRNIRVISRQVAVRGQDIDSHMLDQGVNNRWTPPGRR